MYVSLNGLRTNPYIIILRWLWSTCIWTFFSQQVITSKSVVVNLCWIIIILHGYCICKMLYTVLFWYKPWCVSISVTCLEVSQQNGHVETENNSNFHFILIWIHQMSASSLWITFLFLPSLYRDIVISNYRSDLLTNYLINVLYKYI